MTTIELIKQVQEGSKPVVRFTSEIHDYEGPDENMLARIVKAKPYFNDEDTWVEFILDFSEFMDYNKPLAFDDFFDSNKKPTLTWFETEHFPKAGLWTLCLPVIKENKPVKLTQFKLTVAPQYYMEFKQQTKIKDYTLFLEHKLNKLKK